MRNRGVSALYEGDPVKQEKQEEHELKTWTAPFQAMLDGVKRFEFRKNDRDYRVGNVLRLREWNPDTGYTGRELRAKVTWMLTSGFGLPDGYCVMSIVFSSASHHTDAEYLALGKAFDAMVDKSLELREERDVLRSQLAETKAKLEATNGLLEAASEMAIANGVRYEKAEAENERLRMLQKETNETLSAALTEKVKEVERLTKWKPSCFSSHPDGGCTKMYKRIWIDGAWEFLDECDEACKTCRSGRPAPVKEDLKGWMKRKNARRLLSCCPFMESRPNARRSARGWQSCSRHWRTEE
jgi:hypothetical protein